MISLKKLLANKSDKSLTGRDAVKRLKFGRADVLNSALDALLPLSLTNVEPDDIKFLTVMA